MFAYLPFAWTYNTPSPTLAFLGVREQRRVIVELRDTSGPWTRQGDANLPLHHGIGVRVRILCQLELETQPQEENSGPPTGTVLRRDAQRVTNQGWWEHMGGRACAGESGGLKPSFRRSPTASPKWASNPPP